MSSGNTLHSLSPCNSLHVRLSCRRYICGIRCSSGRCLCREAHSCWARVFVPNLAADSNAGQTHSCLITAMSCSVPRSGRPQFFTLDFPLCSVFFLIDEDLMDKQQDIDAHAQCLGVGMYGSSDLRSNFSLPFRLHHTITPLYFLLTSVSGRDPSPVQFAQEGPPVLGLRAHVMTAAHAVRWAVLRPAPTSRAQGGVGKGRVGFKKIVKGRGRHNSTSAGKTQCRSIKIASYKLAA